MPKATSKAPTAIVINAIVTLDHFLFALAEQEAGARALQSSGVARVPEYEVELLNMVHAMPIPALDKDQAPEVESSMLAILNHALAFARRDGRDSSNLSDVLAAILDALRDGRQHTPGMGSLRKRWPHAKPTDENHQLLVQINDVLGQQPTLLAKALAAELGLLRQRVATLESQKTITVPWYRRLNVVISVAVCIASAALAGLWTIAG